MSIPSRKVMTFLLAFIAPLAVVESYFWFVEYFQIGGLDRLWQVHFEPRPFQRDSNLGYRFKSNVTFHVKVVRGDRVIHDHSSMRTDEWGNRYSPGQETSSGSPALFFGGSCTLGLGVNDGETLPAQFRKLNPQYRSLNFGNLGGSPSMMLTELENPDFLAHLPPPGDRVVLVYTLIQDHIRRDRRSLSKVMESDRGRAGPYFYVDSSGGLRRSDSWLSYHTLELGFFRLLSLSATVRVLVKKGKWDIPMHMGEADSELSAKILGRAQQVFRQRYPKGKFLVVVLKRYGVAPDDVFLSFLRNEGVPFLDMRDKEIPAIPEDGHPNVQGYQQIAQAVSLRLREL